MGMEGMTAGEDYFVLYSSVAGVLAGAVWGDHCSPISDTTVMSSLSAGCDHIEHVRTQLPYALLAGAAALGAGTLPTSFGLPWWLGMLAAAAVTVFGLRLLGEPVEDYRPGDKVHRFGTFTNRLNSVFSPPRVRILRSETSAVTLSETLVNPMSASQRYKSANNVETALT